MTRPRPVGEETVQDVQVMLKSDAHHASIRSLKVLSSPRLLTPPPPRPLVYSLSFPSPPPAVRAGVPSGEGARHHYLGHGGEGQGHEGVPAVSRLSIRHQQHPPASGPAGLRSAAQVQQVSVALWTRDTTGVAHKTFVTFVFLLSSQ